MEDLTESGYAVRFENVVRKPSNFSDAIFVLNTIEKGFGSAIRRWLQVTTLYTFSSLRKLDGGREPRIHFRSLSLVTHPTNKCGSFGTRSLSSDVAYIYGIVFRKDC